MANGFKTGGREAGTPNKRQAIGKRVEKILEYEWNNIHTHMEGISDKEKAEFVLKLLLYATPKYSSRTYQTDVSEDFGIFQDVQIITNVDEKDRLEKVRAYEEKHCVEIL
jgi:hypothetical protein